MNLITAIYGTLPPAIPAGPAALRGGEQGFAPLFAGPCGAWLASMWTKLSPVTVYAGGVRPRETRIPTGMTNHAINHATRRVA